MDAGDHMVPHFCGQWLPKQVAAVHDVIRGLASLAANASNITTIPIGRVSDRDQ